MLERPDKASIPDQPGSYQFRDREGRVIYVGKAKSLRSRVSSYFVPPETLPAKTRAMMAVADSVTWITVASDAEAFMLEYSLIKEHRPRYNIRLRDDKSYPMIAVTMNEQWPRAMLVRGARRPKIRYFGPYANAGAARDTLELLLRALPLRSCSAAKLARHTRDGRPCLYYHIGRCVGPCIGAVSQGEYREMVERVSQFLGGQASELARSIEGNMRAAAASLEFEQAARYRDQLVAIQNVLERQEMVISDDRDLDVFGLCADELEVSLQALRVRAGRVVGTNGIIVDLVEDLGDEEMLTRVVELYYAEKAFDYPSRVILPSPVGDRERLEVLLSELAQRRVQVGVGQRGRPRALVATATENARQEFRRNRTRRATDHNARASALVELAEQLGLESPPLRIECYDMSHLQGTNYVGSMVVMEDGLMKHRDYRHFGVSIPKNDDFAAMEEVLRRRLGRLLDEEAKTMDRSRRFAYRPNLILLDGGAGQLSVGIRVLDELNLSSSIALASLAKSYEEVYRPNFEEPLRLPRGSSALYLLQTLRDESHRFAITYHRRRRTITAEVSVLDQIPGLGPKRRARLLEHYGSVYEIAHASPEELVGAKIVPEAVATQLLDRLTKVYGTNPSPVEE
ncbi:MAG: excinuclease ABC subunit UvrC [Ferrimicrobium sp.]|uniref:excinuclease ABC subunit UvrC n=1 Tax=Ferrimicrobium sp. TaxID=2926050 RepID=UPI00260F1F72|nr:excinuclease ABC subunit UvrC [Ferrimicrobium sp.]